MAAKDMTVGNPTRLILVFTLPLLLGNIFQQLYNMVDSVIVGQFVGKNALAAVMAATPLYMLGISFMMGMTIGTSVIVAQYFGAGAYDRLKTSVSSSLIFLAGLTALLTVLGLIFVHPLLQLVGTPADLIEESTQYLQIVYAGMFFSYLYNTYAAILRGLGNSKMPLVCLVVSSVLNIILDIVFVVCFNLRVTGVAYATVISIAVSAALAMIYSHTRMQELKFKRGEFVFDRSLFGIIMRFSLPSALQQSIVSLGNVFLQGVVNRFGPDIIAGFGAATKVDSFAILPLQNFSSALSTFVGQNIGAQRIDRVREGHRSTMRMSLLICIVLALLIAPTGKYLMRIFVDASETGVIEYGAKFLLIVAFSYIFPGILFTNNGVFRGAGSTHIAMFSSLLSLTVRVGVAYLFAAIPGMGAMGICWSMPIGWGVAGIYSILYYRSNRWEKHSINTRRLHAD